MTIQAAVSEKAYATDGVSTIFAIPFPFDTAADLKLTSTDASGNISTLSTGFTISGGAGSTGNAIFTVAPVLGLTITIYDNPALTQPTDYVSLDAFPAESHERALDRVTRIAKRLYQLIQRSMRFPDGDVTTDGVLGSVANRKGKYLFFNAVTGAIEYAVNLVTTALSQSIIGQLLNPQTIAESNAGATITNYAYAPGWVERYGADNTGVATSSTAFQRAVNQWKQGGSPPRAGPGTFMLDAQVDYITTSANTFIQGAAFIGAGMETTIIDNRVANGFVFNVDTNTTLKFQLGCFFSGFQIKTTTSPATSGGIRLRRAFNVVTDNVHIIGLTGDGIQLVVNEGDGDGPNVVWLRSSRIENCAGWGLNCNLSAGRNELSFVDTSSSIISGNGTASAALPPPSGGIHWKGQICQLRNGSCVINQNVGLYIEGTGGGLPAQFFLENWSFENNVKKHVYCTGIDSFKARNTQLYSNDSFIAQYGMFFDASASAIKGIDIDGVIVRATTLNNAYTAFTISGANAQLDQCRIRRVSWQNFDFAGQTRFSGFQFDAFQQQCEFVVLGTALARLRPKQSPLTRLQGNSSPLRLRGGAGGTPSTSGEWIATQLTSTGLSITNASLAASTQYYAYLYDNNGSTALELSTSVPVIDSASGYPVKTGDATKLYVGSVLTDGSSNFLTASACVPPDLKGRQVVPYSASMTFDASLGNKFDISVTNNTAFTINAPTNPTEGQRITVTIRNISGGALGAVTWNAVFKMSAWTQPANVNSRSIDFEYDGSIWLQIAQTGVDVPN